MTHTFRVPSRRAPAWGPVAAAIGAEGLVVAEGEPTPEWLPGTLHVHEEGTSGFGVTCTRDEEGFTVAVVANAAPGDWDLALRLLRALAGPLDAPVHRPERAAPYDPVELVARWHGKALLALLATELDALEATVAAGPVRLDGVVRPVVLGPATLARVREAGPPEERGARLGDLVARLQWIEHEGVLTPPPIGFQSPDGRAWRAAMLTPGRRLLLADAPHILLADPGSGEAPLVVDRASLAAWAGDAVEEALDETQAIVRVHRGSAWDETWDRALAHVRVRVQKSVEAPEDDATAEPDDDDPEDDEATEERPSPPLPPPPAAKKPWWRFW